DFNQALHFLWHLVDRNLSLGNPVLFVAHVNYSPQ
ncbi:MAG: hypothetical protein ACI8T6_000248, partial [Candidatus Poseidoniaceae archaeon]